MSQISIFYDLETSDLLKVGQILNFCFIACDQELNPIETFKGNIKINRLQLPRVAAILANRTNVLKQQEVAEYTEPQAMQAIADFINKYVDQEGNYKVSLIGYNSAKFDLEYLRTSLIRNGIYPYFKTKNKDLLLLVKKLAFSNEAYQQKQIDFLPESSFEKPNNKLEFQCQMLGLLSGEQTHESEDDVMITIDLAKKLISDYQADVRTFEPYEVSAFHEWPGEVHKFLVYKDAFSKEEVYKYYAFHSDHNSAALWLDLEKLAELKKENQDPKKALRYFNKDKNNFFAASSSDVPVELKVLAKQFFNEIPSITLNEFFTDSECDLEMDIYRLDINAIKTLKPLMDKKLKAKDLDEAVKTLVLRYRLANTADRNINNPQFLASFKDYINYRYSGKMLLSRSKDPEQGTAEYHPTLDLLFAEIQEARENHAEISTDQELIDALAEFYQNSLIYKLYNQEMDS